MIITIGSKIKDNNGDVYVLDNILGKGGFGCVYKAHREKDDYVVAVKILETTFRSKESILSFQKECSQAELISSEYVIKYFYVHDGTVYNEYPPYIIMEYADGGTLADVINNQKKSGHQFELAFIYDAVMQLSEGMKEISKHIVHRDIKPENILIKNGILKIADFGLSKIVDDATNSLTFKGYGTAKYVSPEGWVKGKNTIQMDIYSMGIVFFELATLQYPYTINENADLVEYSNAHLYKAPKNPSAINPSLPQSLVSIIIKMLEKPTQKRFANWDAIISSLSVVPPSTGTLADAVTNALKKRNTIDLKIQAEKAEKERLQKEKEDFCNLVYSQYEATIFDPIENFVDSFNSQYSGERGFKTSNKNFTYKDRFTYEITTPAIEHISIKTEVIFAENFKKQIPVDRIWGDSGYRTINYIPRCKGIDILAWSQVSDLSGKGFNILLLKAKDSIYGDWYILTNTNSGLSYQRRRVEPFGFSLEELPKEINNINTVHIYNLKLSPFDESIIFEYLADHA